MRTKSSYIITLIVDPLAANEVAGKLEVVKNGQSYHFRNWEDLKAQILETLKSNSNAVQISESKTSHDEELIDL